MNRDELRATAKDAVDAPGAIQPVTIGRFAVGVIELLDELEATERRHEGKLRWQGRIIGALLMRLGGFITLKRHEVESEYDAEIVEKFGSDDVHINIKSITDSTGG